MKLGEFGLYWAEDENHWAERWWAPSRLWREKLCYLGWHWWMASGTGGSHDYWRVGYRWRGPTEGLGWCSQIAFDPALAVVADTWARLHLEVRGTPPLDAPLWRAGGWGLRPHLAYLEQAAQLAGLRDDPESQAAQARLEGAVRRYLEVARWSGAFAAFARPDYIVSRYEERESGEARTMALADKLAAERVALFGGD